MAKSLAVCFLVLCSYDVIVGSVSPVFEQVRILERDVQHLKVEVPFLEQKLSNRLKLSEDAMLELIESKIKTAVSDALSGSRSRIRHVQGRDHHMKTEIRRLKEEVKTLKSDQESCEERISRVFTSETEHMSLLTLGLRRELNAAREEIKKLIEDFSIFKNNIVYDYDEDDEYASKGDFESRLELLNENINVLNRTQSESTKCNVIVNVSTDSDRMKNVEETLQQQAAQIRYLHATSNETLQKISSNADQNNNQGDTLLRIDAVKGGVVYTRWGRKGCPPGSNLIYTGAAGGNAYNYKGGPANTLCLPMDPEYNNYTTNNHDRGYIYGTEYETSNQLPEFNNFQDEDVPCAVCETPQKSRTLMIPAKMSCPPGWRQEYTGYLMGGHYDHAASDFVCVDKAPHSLHGGRNDVNGHLFYLIEGACGSLKCPPYKQYWELTCVVCSK